MNRLCCPVARRGGGCALALRALLRALLPPTALINAPWFASPSAFTHLQANTTLGVVGCGPGATSAEALRNWWMRSDLGAVCLVSR
jgi:hypothetical protein